MPSTNELLLERELHLLRVELKSVRYKYDEELLRLNEQMSLCKARNSQKCLCKAEGK